jgi:hypothetical protein
MIKLFKKMFSSEKLSENVVTEQPTQQTYHSGSEQPIETPSIVLKEKKPNKHSQVVKKDVCNCCGNATVTYRRKIGHSILKPLTTAFMYCKQNKTNTFHIQKSQSADYNMNSDLAKARYYGIIESAIIDGKKHVGLWKFTEFGIKFMKNEVKVQEYFILRNGDLKGFEGELKSYLQLLNSNEKA